MTVVRQVRRAALCLLTTCLLGGCGRETAPEDIPTDSLRTDDVALGAAPEAPPAADPPARTPTIAIYPLVPHPTLTPDASAGALVAQLEHGLRTAVGDADGLVLLDRSNVEGDRRSPERLSLATTLAADYVLTGLVSRHDGARTLRLQLSHVASHRLAAIGTFERDAAHPLDAAGIVRFLRSSVERDRAGADDGPTFRVAMAGVLPTSGAVGGFPVAASIGEDVTERLLRDARHAVVSGELAHALYLESARSPDRSAARAADVVVHARLLDADREADGLDLVLFIERIGGVRKVVPLHARTADEMARSVMEAVDRQLGTVPPVSAGNARAARERIGEAWRALSGNGRPAVELFPRRATERKASRLESFGHGVDAALALDPGNPDALAGAALLRAFAGEHAASYSMLQRLLWDPRPAAFDLGVRLLRRKLSMGTTPYLEGNLAGLPGGLSEREAVDELTRHGWMTERDGHDWPWWDLANRATSAAGTERALWDYALGIRNTELDSLARFKTARWRSPRVGHPSRRADVSTGMDETQSLHYALADSVAPLYLSVGLDGFYSARVELEGSDADPAASRRERLYLFQSLAGMAALGDTPAIEPDVLFAAALCRYHRSLCASARQLFASVVDRAGSFRRHVVRQAHDAERTTAYANALIAMARKRAAERDGRTARAPGPLPPDVGPVADVERGRLMPEDLDRIPPIDGAFERCVDCAGLVSLRNVHASPDGRWLATARPYRDVEDRYTAEPEVAAWMFDRGYLDVAGRKTVFQLPREATSRLRRDFPRLGEEELRRLAGEFGQGEFEVDEAGLVELSRADGTSTTTIASPDLRPEAHFGKRVALGDDRAVVCDQWGEGHRFVPVADGWEPDRSADELCDGSHLALVGDWAIKANGAHVVFHEEGPAAASRRAVRDVRRDFPGLDEGAVVRGLRAHDALLVARIDDRAGYHLGTYRLHGTSWQPTSLLRSPGHFTAFAVFDDRVYQLHRGDVLVHAFDGVRLQLSRRYRMASTWHPGEAHLSMMRDASGTKLVADYNGDLHQLRLR